MLALPEFWCLGSAPNRTRWQQSRPRDTAQPGTGERARGQSDRDGTFRSLSRFGLSWPDHHPKVVEEIEEIVRKAHAKNIEVLAVIFSKTPDEMQSEPSTGLTLAAEASRQEATEGSSPLASGQ